MFSNNKKLIFVSVLLPVVIGAVIMAGLVSYATAPSQFTGGTTNSGGYSGVVGPGQSNQVAYYSATGTTVFGNALMTINNGTLQLGTANGIQGALVLCGSTSGSYSILAPAVAGNGLFTLPSGSGTNGQVLGTDGAGHTSWVSSGGGSTGVVGNGTTGQITWYQSTGTTVVGNVNANMSNGVLTLGVSSTTRGALVLEGATSGAVTVQVPATAGTTTFQLPPNNGPLFGFLQTDSTGVTTWQVPWNTNASDLVINASVPQLQMYGGNVTMSGDAYFQAGTTINATGTIYISHQLYNGDGSGYSGGYCDATGLQYPAGGPAAGYVPLVSSGLGGGNGGGSYGYGGVGGGNTYTYQGSGTYSEGYGSIAFTPGSGGSAAMCNSGATSYGGDGAGWLRLLAQGAITIDGSIDGAIRNDGDNGQTAVETTTITIGGTVTSGDIVTLTFTNSDIAGSPLSIPYTCIGTDTTTTIATNLTTLINAATPLSDAEVTATSSGAVITVVSADFQQTTFDYSLSDGATETVTIGTTMDQASGAGAGGGGVTALYSQTSISYVGGGFTTTTGGIGGGSLDYNGGAGGGGGAHLLIAPTISGGSAADSSGGGYGFGAGSPTYGGNGVVVQMPSTTPTLPLISRTEHDFRAIVAMQDAKALTSAHAFNRRYTIPGREAVQYISALDSKTDSDFRKTCFELNNSYGLFTTAQGAQIGPKVTMEAVGDAVAVPGGT
jgi:hypothetical protein